DAGRRDRTGDALDGASALRWTRSVTHPSWSAAIPAMEVCLHPRDGARRNRGSAKGPLPAPIGGCGATSPRLAPTRGLLRTSLVPRTLSGPGDLNERD